MSVIEDLERADQKSAYEKEMERKSPARCVEKVRNIWLSLNEYFCEINEKVISLRSTEWVGKNPVIETNYTRHNGELGRLALPFNPRVSLGYNQFDNPLDRGFNKTKEMDFVPFLLEDFVFEIKTTKSSIKKNVFGKWLDNPPLGYILVGSQVINDDTLKVHLTLEDTSLTDKAFRNKMRVFARAKALSQIESISADLFNLFRDQNLAFLEDMKDKLDPTSSKYDAVIFERKSKALIVLNHNMNLAHKIWLMTRTLTQTLKETVRHNRDKKYHQAYCEFSTLYDLLEETRGISEQMCGHSSMTWRKEDYSSYGDIGMFEWPDFTNHNGTYLFSSTFIDKVEKHLPIVGTLSEVERFLVRVYQWDGGEENCSSEVLSSFTDHTDGKFDLDTIYSW